ncbi:membrane progestin receptor alpha-B-like [Acipenser oxyrinchus oxyrinchus]|uniref:Membrane progestin receptor alpha-B-like n=1 Tax=Acipenser oxyrinchus oxyrinchus TaxID=40147 RepID=A0AAD8FYW2_ACIOX|nr:membrane progestin receptor alpha-B-like [Acipenser oxyrinchus oxyrinchus]
MATIAMEQLGRLFISLQQVRGIPRMLDEAAPSLPCTLRESEVPRVFRERHINAGYRPIHQNWRYYFLSLFQRHNETINVWSHLLAALVVLMKFSQLSESVDFLWDPHAWPLFILLLSSFTYMTCSALAHLLSAKSELCHYSFFFLDYTGVAVYQYGSALVHFYYAIEEGWHTQVKGFFLPTAAFLSWLSCAGCCTGKYKSHMLPKWVRKLGQVVPSGLAYVWDISPVILRIYSCFPCAGDQAVSYHIYQVSFFLASALFFTYPLPEMWFPGRCNFLGQGHQVFHVFLALCTLAQIEASHLDYLARQPLYSRLHGDSSGFLIWALLAATALSSALTAVYARRKVCNIINSKDK